ncbi:MAG: heat-shock protein [Comamonadaceae bacterium]|nr:heat-shock protein [Comamonadaceae bacterium]
MSNNTQVTTSTPTSASTMPEQDPQRAVLPAVDVFEDAGGITLLADMPGVPKEHLELKVEGESLLIEGGVQPSTPDGLEAIYAEMRVPRFRRSFALSRELDTSRIEASLKDGVLTLRIPKQAHAQPRRIAVTAG